MKESDFNFAKGLKSVNLRAIWRNAIKEQEQDILDLQKEQLSAGIADKGDEIQPGYARKTVAIKRQKGQPTDRVTLKDTGAFYRDQYVKYTRGGFELTSRNRKRKKLEDKYHGNRGGDIFGLTEENKLLFADQILPVLQQEYRDKVLKALRR